MNDFESVARANNKAVSLLLVGETKIAIETLMESIALLKPLLSGIASSCQQQQASTRKKSKCSPPQETTIGTNSSSLVNSHDVSLVLENVCIHQASSPLSILTGRQNYVYNRAFRFSMEDATHRTTNATVECASHIYGAIILFNAALAYHGGSLNGNKACANRAIMMYSKVLKLLRHIRGVAGSTAAVMKVAALNNISQIRFDEGEYHRAQESLDQLSELLYILKDTPNEYREILMNVLFLKAPKVAAAA
jgi:hypothetical protein